MNEPRPLSAARQRQITNRLSAVSILGNLLLSCFKLLAGLMGHSGAMLSDAVHSLSDVFTTVVAWLGVRLSMQEADEEHPYGHERLECVASLLLGSLLLLTGLLIGYAGCRKIAAGSYNQLAVPGRIALAAAILSILTKEGMYRYTRYYAKLLDSPAFLADAWHHRSDALSSVGSLIGIGGAMLGWPVLDPLAEAGIALCILKVAYDILRDALSRMLDTACSPEFEAELGEFIRSQPGVLALDVLHTRTFGSRIYVDAEISADGRLTLTEAHRIAEAVHDGVEQRFAGVKHIMIHVNPA